MIVYGDLYMQVVLVVLFGKGDVIVVVLKLGCVFELLCVFDVVMQVGVKVIVIMLSNMLFVKCVIVVFEIDYIEMCELQLLMILWILYLLMIDIFVVGVVICCVLMNGELFEVVVQVKVCVSDDEMVDVFDWLSYGVLLVVKDVVWD